MSKISNSDNLYPYPSDRLDFKKYDKCVDNTKWTRSFDDPAYIDDKANRSKRPLRFITRNFHDLGLNPNSLCYPGFLPQDGSGIHPEGVNTDSDLRYSRLTNIKIPQQLGCLPLPTIPLLQKGCINVDAEMKLRGEDVVSRKTCNPKETNFYVRSFQIFDGLCYNPNDPNISIFPARNQSGIDTRHLRVEPYRNSGSPGLIKSTKSAFRKRLPKSNT